MLNKGRAVGLACTWQDRGLGAPLFKGSESLLLGSGYAVPSTMPSTGTGYL